MVVILLCAVFFYLYLALIHFFPFILVLRLKVTIKVVHTSCLIGFKSSVHLRLKFVINNDSNFVVLTQSCVKELYYSF